MTVLKYDTMKILPEIYEGEKGKTGGLVMLD
jgi:hypothetical protein